jgi:plastocyanin
MAITVLAGALSAPATALADQEIAATTGNAYTTTSITMAQGEPLNFKNNDLSVKHDVVSTANGEVKKQYLFASDTIEGGKSSFVEGSQYLTTGTYDFYCSVHPAQMKGKITVTAAGTPQARPGTTPGGPGTTNGTPAADQLPPEAGFDYGNLSAKRIKAKKRLTLKVSADEASTATVTVRIGKVKLKAVRVRFARRSTKIVQIKLSAKAVKAVKARARLRVVVEAVDSAGNPGSATDSAKLE